MIAAMQSWLKDPDVDRSIIRIQEEGITRKYLVTNRSDIRVGGMHIKSTNECRWVVRIKSVNEDHYVIELLTLENVITETNNPMVKDVAGFNNVFKELYNELVMEVGLSGELRAVKNPGTLRSKWHRIREEMKRLGEEQHTVLNVIRLNDDIFDNDENLFNVVKATEFFELFFIGFYGKRIPGMKKASRPNKFKGAKYEWIYEFTRDNHLAANDVTQVKMEGFVNFHFSKSNLEAMYGKFDFLDYKAVRPDVRCNGLYTLERSSGMIAEAVYTNYEVIDPAQLYSKNHYTIKTYE